MIYRHRAVIGGAIGGTLGLFLGYPASVLMMLFVFYHAGLPTLAEAFRIGVWIALTAVAAASGAWLAYNFRLRRDP